VANTVNLPTKVPSCIAPTPASSTAESLSKLQGWTPVQEILMSGDNSSWESFLHLPFDQSDKTPMTICPSNKNAGKV